MVVMVVMEKEMGEKKGGKGRKSRKENTRLVPVGRRIGRMVATFHLAGDDQVLARWSSATV